MDDDVFKEIEKWGAISTAVPSVVALLVLLVVIVFAIQLKRIRVSNGDLRNNISRLESELQNLGMTVAKRGDEQNGNFQRLDSAVLALPQTILNQLSSLSRKEYNDEIINRSGGLLPTRAVGPPVPPKRASSSFFKPTYY